MTVESVLLFKTIFEQTPTSTQVFTPDGETIMVNAAWEKLWHVPFAKIKSYNILKDKQLVEKGIMPLIKRGFAGESVELPVIKYVPSKTVSVKGMVSHRWLGAKLYPIRDEKNTITHVVLQHEDITQTVESEEMKYRLAAIVESSDDAIVSKNLSGIINSWNKGAERLFGYSAKDAIGKSINIIIPKHLLSEEDRIIRRIKSGKSITHYETTRRTKSGKPVQVSLSISPVRDAQGKVIGASNITRDISERRMAEEAVRESEALFRTLTSHAPVGIFLSDKDGKCLFVNSRWCEFAGMTPEQAMGDGWAKALHPDDREIVFTAWKESTQKGKVFNLDYRFITPKGKVTWLSGSSVALRDRKKQVTGYLGTITDITYQKASEEVIRESEERLRIALEAGKIGVWDWNIKEGKLTWTENVYKIHGVTSNNFNVTFESFSALIHPDDKELVLRSISHSVAGKLSFKIDFRIITPKGELRWVSTSAFISFDSKGKAKRMLGATLDITEQKQLEQEKSDFLSMASHELKTPLTSVKIFLDLLRAQIDEKKEVKSAYYLRRISDQTDRLAGLISDLLDVSRIETGKLRLQKERFSLLSLLTDTIDSIQPAANGHRIVLRYDERVTLYADKYRLSQVVVNLLTNAIKYSPKDDDIQVSMHKNKKEVIIAVKDNGIGVAAEKQKKIFEKLYQVTDPKERTYPGLGLGLYISKEIVERHGGKIWVESKGKEKGSTFYFSLPMKKVK